MFCFLSTYWVSIGESRTKREGYSQLSSPSVSDQSYLMSLHFSLDVATNLLVLALPASSVPYIPTHRAAHHSRQLPGPYTASKPTITL